MRHVLQDIKDDTLAQEAFAQTHGGAANSSAKGGKPAAAAVNGASGGNGTGTKRKGREGEDVPGFRGRGEGGVSLALPRVVVEEGVKITRECLELVCEVPE